MRSKEELWEQGFCDQAIAYLTDCSVNQVEKWRSRRNLCMNQGRVWGYRELERLLPEEGQTVFARPYIDGCEELPPMEAEVIQVNREHLLYTVRFRDLPWKRESYRVI